MGGWGWGGNLSSVMEECGAVSLGQGIPFHTWAERARQREKETAKGGEGRAWVELGLFLRHFEGWTPCSSGLFSIPINSGEAEPSQGNTTEQTPD